MSFEPRDQRSPSPVFQGEPRINFATWLAELRRRNVLRTGALYPAGAWALAQGVAQLVPVFGVRDWVSQWIVIATVIGSPFWLSAC